MAARQISTESVARMLLELGDDIQANFDATANKAKITEAGRLVRSMADLLNIKPTVEYHQGERAEKSKQASWLTRFKNVVDTALEWLEHCGQVDAQKLEQVLRGLYNLTGTLSYIVIVSKTFQDFSQFIEKYKRGIF